MQFHEVFPGVTTKVLEYIIRHRSEKLWHNKIAKSLNISSTAVVNVVSDLEGKGLLRKEKIGRGLPAFIYLNGNSEVVERLITFIEGDKNAIDIKGGNPYSRRAVHTCNVTRKDDWKRNAAVRRTNKP